MNHYNHYADERTERQEFDVLTEDQIIARIQTIDKLVAAKDAMLAEFHPYIVELMEKRHASYDVPNSLMDKAVAVSKQLYEEPTYNGVFVHGFDSEGMGGDLDARKGRGYAEADNYTAKEYTDAIFKAARDLGYVAPDVPKPPTDPVDARLGIADSYLEPIDEEVEAVIVSTAKSISNPIRVRDAIRNIESGKIRTKKILIASSDRPVDDAERQKMEELQLDYGSTEFESAVAAFSQLSGQPIDVSRAEQMKVTLGKKELDGRKLQWTFESKAGPIECVAIAAPFDPERVERVLPDGTKKFADRTNTQENFLGVLGFLSQGSGLVVIESHDVWAKGQAEIADQIIGPMGKNSIAAGPFKLDRLVRQDDGSVVLNEPGQVVDEIAKTFNFAIATRTALLNTREALDKQLQSRQSSVTNSKTEQSGQ